MQVAGNDEDLCGEEDGASFAEDTGHDGGATLEEADLGGECPFAVI